MEDEGAALGRQHPQTAEDGGGTPHQQAYYTDVAPNSPLSSHPQSIEITDISSAAPSTLGFPATITTTTTASTEDNTESLQVAVLSENEPIPIAPENVLQVVATHDDEENGNHHFIKDTQQVIIT